MLFLWVPASKASRNINENTNPVKLLGDCYVQPFLVNFTAYLIFILSCQISKPSSNLNVCFVFA